MSDKGITLEGLAAAVDALREELATWKALAHKQDALTAAQITATQSGATAAKIDQIAVNTAAIQALAAQVAGQISLEYVTTLPATGEPLTLYLVPQGDGTAPNYCNEYLWVNNDWELIGTTGSMANNGELTIQVNGAAVGTFTANQAANSAINITVPTNTNQLVNGAQYVDASALATALALKQNNLNAAQLDAVNSGITAALVTQIGTNQTAIAGKQDALTTAQQAAVDSGATAAKIDQIASNAAAIVSLTSSKQDALSTAQLAAVNSGITSAAVQQISTNTGDIATKAADSAVVHLAGAETITGDKTFTGAVVTRNITPETDNTYSLGSSTFAWSSVYAQSYYYNGTEFLDKFCTLDTEQNISARKNYLAGISMRQTSITTTSAPAVDTGLSSVNVFDNSYRFWGAYSYAWRANGDTELLLALSNWTDGGGQGYWEIAYGVSKAMTSSYFIPKSSGFVDLGTSDNKWKSLNGLNPGKLSLPQDGAARIDISSAITDTTWTAPNLYTPQVDGWLAVLIESGRCIIQRNGTYGLSAGSYDSTDVFDLRVFLPVIAGATYEIFVRGTLKEASLYPCQGNV